jgi:hypothetical protein
MKHHFIYKLLVCLVLATMTIACSNHDRAARAYLAQAELAYETGNFPLAMLKIDSIRILFPRAFPEIRESIALRQRVRMAETLRNIAFADSMLYEKQAIFNEKRLLFDFVHDADLQDFGEFYPRIYPHSASLNRSGLRSGVTERGTFFIESVLVGNPIRHHKIRAATRDGGFAETLSVTSEGFNHRFTTIDNSYEIVRYRGDAENGVGGFIKAFQNQPITVQFMGNRTTSITLSNAEKQGIAQSLELSMLITDIEQLKFEKSRGEVLVRYLESRMQGEN